MRLNGWQRLYVLVAVLWTIVVAILTWSTWPQRYRSFDPKAGIPPPPIGSDVTYLMDGIIKANERLTRSEFASRIKAKYPEYLDQTDEELVTATLKKYPHYRPYLADIPVGYVPDPPEVVNALNRSRLIVAMRFALLLWLLPPAALYGAWIRDWVGISRIQVSVTHFPGKHWGEHVRKRICPRFEQFGELVLSRVLPAFDGINEEATALQHRRYGELVSSLEVPEEHMSDAGEAMADLAFNEAMDHAVLLESMKFSTLNLFAAALYHLTEQHLIDLPLQILGYDGRHNLRPEHAVSWFNDTIGLDLASLPSWPVIDELRLVANVVKHGEGKSAEELRKLRADLFVYPTLREDRTSVGTLRMEASLFGQDFFVTKEEFVRYHKGSVAFWTELADALPALTK